MRKSPEALKGSGDDNNKKCLLQASAEEARPEGGWKEHWVGDLLPRGGPLLLMPTRVALRGQSG